MKINFLGTAAYERIPSIFCNCPTCALARKKGKKEIRTQAQVLIDRTLLIDFGMDNYAHSINSKIDFSKIENLLITHPHEDHFILEELRMRDEMGSKNLNVNLNIYGATDTQETFNSKKTFKCDFNLAEMFKTYNIGDYKVTVLPALHTTADPRTYLISDGKTTLYYCLDTGLPNEKTYDFLKEKGIKIDAVICDCTYGVLEIENDGYHMSLLDNIAHKEKLIEIGAIKKDTTWVVTHFSHNGLNKNGKAVSFKEFNKLCKKNGFILAYDGLKLEIK